MEIRIRAVQQGVNEEGAPFYAPETPPPTGFISVEIADGWYIYTMPETQP